jgi:5-formyltetrahydrofolate cyclo-ligase
MNLTTPKPLLRAEMKRRRAGFAADLPLAGNDMADALAAILDEHGDWPPEGTTVAGYWPIQSEINPFPLMQLFADRGYLLCLPCLEGSESGYRMIFRDFRIGDELTSGPLDLRQPPETSLEALPDIVLVPLLAYDVYGHRLGYGGGYYDRALEALRALKPIKALGVAFSGQQLAEIPFEVHDQRLDGIVTELGLAGAEPQ